MSEYIKVINNEIRHYVKVSVENIVERVGAVNVDGTTITGNGTTVPLVAHGVWGVITGTLSSQTDLQAALNLKITANGAITGATKTKITYDSNGLVTGGTDATTADIADTSNKRYVTDADLVKLGNTSGTNTGDQDLSSFLTSATAASTYSLLGHTHAATDIVSGTFAAGRYGATTIPTTAINAINGATGKVLSYDGGWITPVTGSDISVFLVKASNLSDLTNAGTARTNLGLGTLATQSATITDYLLSATAASTYSLLGHTHTFGSLTSTPTTISGYGITDFNSLGDARWSVLAHTHTFASLTSKPTTLSGYGITDAYPLVGNPSAFLTSVPAQSFASLTGKPTTIAGYGITDYNSLGDARWSLLAHTHTFASLTSKPTTVLGYGITDAYTQTTNINNVSSTSVINQLGGTAARAQFKATNNAPNSLEMGITSNSFTTSGLLTATMGYVQSNIAPLLIRAFANSIIFGTGTGGNTEALRITNTQQVGIGVTPSAVLHLKAGTGTANTAPLKFTSGTLVSVIAGAVNDGAVEYNGTHFYATIGSTRYQLDQQSGGGGTWGTITGTLSAQTDLQNALNLKLNTASAFTQGNADALYSVLSHTHTFASLTSKPTTLSGYGITDAYPLTGNPSGFLTSVDTLYSADGTLAGNRAVDLNGNSLNFTQSGNTVLKLYGNAGLEAVILVANSTETPTAQTRLNLYSNNDNGYRFNLSAYDAIKTVQISGDATLGTLAYSADTHTFSGSVIIGGYTMPAADGTPGQIMTTDGSGAVTFEDAPTTDLSAYLTSATAASTYAVISHTHTFASLTSKPTTLSGYGITDAASNTLTSAHIFVGNVSNVATDVAVTGDVTIDNAGVTTIGALKVTNGMLAGSIAYSKLSLSGAILNADLAGSIAYSKLSLTGAILNADLAGSIAYSKLSLTGAILNADLAGSIAYSKLSLSGAILNADLAGSIANAKLTNSTISGIALGSNLNSLTPSTGITGTAYNGSAAVSNWTNNLSTGVSGGQSVIGGTASGNALTLSSTSHATKGKLLFGTSAYDEVNNRLGIGLTAPDQSVHTTGAFLIGASNVEAGSGSRIRLRLNGTVPEIQMFSTGVLDGLISINASAQFSFNAPISVTSIITSSSISAATVTTTGSITSAGSIISASVGGTNPNLRMDDGDVTLPNYSSVGISPALGTGTIFNAGSASGSGANGGGVQIGGFTTSGANAGLPFILLGYHGGTAPTTAAVSIWAYKWDGGTNRTALAATEKVFQVANTGSTPLITVLGNGNTGIGQTAPTSVLHLKAGTATASTAPLKLTSGTSLTTAEAGAMEYDGTNLFFTRSGTTRETVSMTPTVAILGSNFTTTSGTLVDVTGMVNTVAANKKYYITGTLRTACDNTGGLQIAFTIPASATILVNVTGSRTSNTAIGMSTIVASATANGQAMNNVAADGEVIFQGYIVTAGTAGSIQLQLRSTTGTQLSTIYSGSGMHIREVL